MIRPIGKSTKLACFQEEATEGVYIAPTKETPFKSCDLKLAIKTEEDASNVGEVFTTDLVNTGQEITGNIEMNVYPETIKNIFYFTLGKKDETKDAIKGCLFFNYIGSGSQCRYSVYNNAGNKYLLIEEYTTTWSTVIDLDIQTLSLSSIVTALNNTNKIKANYDGEGTGADFELETNKIIFNTNDDLTAVIFAYKNTSTYKSKYIYSSNSVLDSIPSFSALVDKNYGAGKCFGYAGCKINTMSLNFAVKTFLTTSVSVRAKQELQNQTDTSADFVMTNPYVTNNCKIYLNSVEFSDIKDLKLDVNNNMYVDEAVGVYTYNAQDRQGATINVSGTANLTVGDEPNATVRLNENWVNNKAVSLLIVLKADTQIESNIVYKTYIFIPKLKLSDASVSIGGAERLTLSFAGQTVSNSLLKKHIEIFINAKE